MAKRTLYIHAGLHKSASTFLQNNVFPFCRKPEYVGYERFDPQAHGDVLLSHEGFLGEPETGYADALKRVETYFDDFERVKILLIIRRQDSFCSSMYVQQLHEGGVKNPLEYIRFDSDSAAEGDVVYAGDLDWYKIVVSIQKLFPNLELTIVPFELIKADFYEFKVRIFRFLDCQEFSWQNSLQNRSYSKLSCEIALWLNRFFKSPRNSSGLIPQRPFFEFFQARRTRNNVYRFGASISYRMTVRYVLQHVLDRLITYRKPDFFPSDTKRAILEMCREGNAALDAEFDLNLEGYGYYK